MSENTDFTTDIQFLRGDDWVGIYKNGRLLYDGHSIQEEDVVRYVLGSCKPTLWVDNEKFWDHAAGRCPDTWDDVETILSLMEVKEDQHHV